MAGKSVKSFSPRNAIGQAPPALTGSNHAGNIGYIVISTVKETAYLRLFNMLRSQILDGSYSAGAKLPTERQICDNYGVSRITCRHAFRLLQEQGFIERYQGRGTIVRSTQPRKLPILVNDYSESISKLAPSTDRKLMYWERIVPPKDITDILGLFKMESCWLAERIDYLEGKPIAFDKAYIPMGLASKITAEMLARVDFLTAWLESENLEMSHVQNSIEAVKATQEIRKRLQVSSNYPILKVTDIMYASTGKVLSVFVTFYRGDSVRMISTSYRNLDSSHG
jgi:GntR family transcriptional regulator